MAIFSAIAYGIGYAIGFLGASVGLSLSTILTLSGAATSLVASAALSAVARALAPKPSIPQQEIQALISQTEAPRRIYVGHYLVGGIRAFFDVKDNVLFQLVMVGHGEITEFVSFWIDGAKVTRDGVGNVTSKPFVKNYVEATYDPETGQIIGTEVMESYVNVVTRDGSGFGGSYGRLVEKFTTWNTSRKLTGQATFLVEAHAPQGNDFMKVFPKGYNTTFQWIIKGQAVYNPKNGNTVYRDNAALVIAHYLTHPEGFRMNPSEISWDSVEAMADVADQLVPQLGGGNAVNLRLWGYWTLDEDPAQVLARMHTSSGIRAYEMQDGKIGLIGGPYGTPACTLTAKDIREIQTSEAISEREGYNVLRVFHLSPAQKYEIIEVDPWRDAARLAQEGEIAQEHRLEMCPNLSQARRLSKQQIYDDNRQKITIITNLVGMKARWPRYNGQRHTIMLDYQPEDGSGRVIKGEYEVLDHEFDPVGLECRVELGRVNRASGDWTPAEEGETIANLPEPESNPAPPMSAVLSQRVIRISASVSQAILEVSAAAVPDRNDLSIEVQFRRVGAVVWREMISTGLTAQSGAVEDGEEYEARVRWRGVFEGIAPWVALGPIPIEIDATPPGKPMQLIPSNSGGHVHLSWRNPASEFFSLRIYRGITNDLGSAGLIGTTGGVPGQISEYQDDTIAAATKYYYWVRAANVSGVEGTAAGPASITTP